MSELETKAVDLLNKMEALTESYAPEVYNKAIEVTQLASFAALVETFVTFVIGLALMYAGYRFFVLAKKKFDDGERSEFWEVIVPVVSVIGGAIGTVFSSVAFIFLFDVWTWIGVFNPELALAYKVLGL